MKALLKNCKIFIYLTICLAIAACQQDESYKARLYTPTYLANIDGQYFIVDCWHHRIIYNNNLHDPIAQWKTLTDHIAGPHSIVSDGKILMTEDTGRHRLFIFQKNNTNQNYELTQTIEHIGKRPHRIIYDKQTHLFYVIAAISQQISAIKDNNGIAQVLYTQKLPFLQHAYTRSIAIIDDAMVFVSGPDKIIFTTYKDGQYHIIKQYDVPPAFASMNDIAKIGQYYYITASPKLFVRVKNLADLNQGKYEDLSQKMGYKGTPYLFNMINGRIFLPEITEYSAIISFTIRDDKISDIIDHYDFGAPTQASIDRKKAFKK